MGVSRPLGYMMLGAAGAVVTERVARSRQWRFAQMGGMESSEESMLHQIAADTAEPANT
jgi:hypothetical protein